MFELYAKKQQSGSDALRGGVDFLLRRGIWKGGVEAEMPPSDPLQPEVIRLGRELRQVDVFPVHDLHATARPGVLLLLRHRPQPHEHEDSAARGLSVLSCYSPQLIPANLASPHPAIRLRTIADQLSQRELPRRRSPSDSGSRGHRLLGAGGGVHRDPILVPEFLVLLGGVSHWKQAAIRVLLLDRIPLVLFTLLFLFLLPPAAARVGQLDARVVGGEDAGVRGSRSGGQLTPVLLVQEGEGPHLLPEAVVRVTQKPRPRSLPFSIMIRRGRLVAADRDLRPCGDRHGLPESTPKNKKTMISMTLLAHQPENFFHFSPLPKRFCERILRLEICLGDRDLERERKGD